MAGPLEDSPEGRRRRKAVALVLLVVTLIVLAIALAWWFSLPDEDPGNPGVEDIAEEVGQAGD